MSPGKPGAGGAETRRTGWRRRRRRRRLEAATTAGPDSGGRGAVQGARGMKPAARAARPPRRSPGLRWALPPLLLLLRLGQILCSGAAPGPVSDVQVTSVSTTAIGLAWSSNGSDSFEIRVRRTCEGGEFKTVTNTNESIVIGGLNPGTKYCFQIRPNGTQELFKQVEGQTESIAVSDIRVVHVSTTEMELWWQSTDSASQYTYHLDIQSEVNSTERVHHGKNITLRDLMPGTLYNITVTPEMGSVQGTSSSIAEYTRPSSVSDIQVITNTTAAEISWRNSDNASSSYTYHLLIDGNSGNLIEEITGVGVTSAVVTELTPGSSYTVQILAQVGNATSGDSSSVSFSTEPNVVSGLHVTSMGTTEVTLTWSNDNSTASYRMLLESIGSQKDLTQDSVFNISDLKPGMGHRIRLVCLVSNETLEDTERGEEANNTERSQAKELPGSPTAPMCKYLLESAELLSRQRSWGTEVQLVDLKSGTQYKATVYSQAADGTEGQPQIIEFRTNSSQVFGLRIVNISATSMYLTWNISADVSSYQIQVVGGGTSFSLTAKTTHAAILELTSSTLYNITVYPLHDDGSAGVPGFLQAYTPPGPVSDFEVMSVGTTEIGLAWSSNDSDSFEIYVRWTCGGGVLKNETTTNQSIVIRGLNPGTEYCFEIFPQGPNGTQGLSETVTGQTASSEVCDIHVVHVSTTEMELQWQSTDTAAQYTYHVDVQSEVSSTKRECHDKNITLRDLMPGTLYNITVTPEMGSVLGKSSFIAEYTRPSSVSDIQIITSTTAAEISWKNSDNASSSYTYHLLINGNSSNPIEEITGVGVTSAVVTGLLPGSSHTVEIFAQVGNVTSGELSSVSFCTEPSPVEDFQCDPVPKEPTLVLTWASPPGTNAGFKIDINNTTHDNVTCLESYSSENGSTCMTNVPGLNYWTTYNISISTLSCGKSAFPASKSCTTGITDPPSPVEFPVITSISHNSLKVNFNTFSNSHGPIKAYAVILTTDGEAPLPSPDVLGYTYEDFSNRISDTYVTYLIITNEKRSSQGLSGVLTYEVDIGNNSKTCSYTNGKLKPLGSYRVSVAGFTKIYPQNCELVNGTQSRLINGSQSYVTFTNYSDAVLLPQDPGVICGAVFGCIFGTLVIVAAGGFIFWRKKRKDAKNNEVSFSQIKPKRSKLIKVENFEAYFKKQQADSNCGFAEEYEDLKLVGVNQPKYAAELPENRGKNRYNNVLPYDISRVKLSVQTHSTDDYINANYMPGYHSKRDFIAMQGPLPNTLKDFWRMVWEKNVYAIVMLTKCVEQGRTKCEEYWPSKQAKDYGDITVAMTSEIVLPEWTIRDFTVKNVQTSESHPLRQFHFTSWPDHGVPDTTDLLINFRYLVRDYVRQCPPETPILVHCSAGVGRTGTFIAIDRLIYQIENENTVDVYGIVYDLRMHRPLMVQTEDQYVFLNQCVLDIIRSQKDSKVDLIYQNTTAMTIYDNFVPVPRFGRTNGYIA